MTTDDLLKAFANAGLDTPEKVSDVLSELTTTLELRRVDAALEAINAKRQEALKPIEDERIDLQNKRNDLALSLGA